jgi:hypothetical protein
MFKEKKGYIDVNTFRQTTKEEKDARILEFYG